VGEVCFNGSKSFVYEALVITREGMTDDDESKVKKPFKFNIPSKLIEPLRNALNRLLEHEE
jgi:hypothetical protein